METEKWINDESKYHPDEISRFCEGELLSKDYPSVSKCDTAQTKVEKINV